GRRDRPDRLLPQYPRRGDPTDARPPTPIAIKCRPPVPELRPRCRHAPSNPIERNGTPMPTRRPAADQVVLPHVLRRRAAEHPDRVFVVFEDGTRWTYSETLRQAESAAAGL